MRTYTIHLNSQFSKLLEELSRKTKIPRHQIVERALLLYKKELERQEMLMNLIESAGELANDPESLKDIAELKALPGLTLPTGVRDLTF